MMAKSKEYIPVLRVTQLDTNELDESLLLTLKQSINQDFFKYVQYNFFQKYHSEIFAGIKLVLWYNTYFKNSQTVGQSILEWSYNTNQNKFQFFKKLIHCFIYCFDDWFQEKFSDLVKNLVFFYRKIKNKRNGSDQSDDENNFLLNRKIDKITHILATILKTASFFNYLVFLFNGKYLHLWERILRLKPSYNREQLLKNFNHEISEREELWQTYFSLFKLIDSFINFNKIYTKISKIRKRKVNTVENELNIKMCPLCENEPTMVHCSKNYDKLESCKHIYCYLCIKKALVDSNNKFECPICKKLVFDIELYIANQSE